MGYNMMLDRKVKVRNIHIMEFLVRKTLLKFKRDIFFEIVGKL